MPRRARPSKPGVNQDTAAMDRPGVRTWKASVTLIDEGGQKSHREQLTASHRLPARFSGKQSVIYRGFNQCERIITKYLRIGNDLSGSLYFPFHVNSSQPSLRIARKSSWVEVEVPIHTAPNPERFDSWTQLLFPKRHSLTLWAIPRVNLVLQPSISVKTKNAKDPSWIQLFLKPIFSDAEDALGQNSSSPAKTSLKDTLRAIIASYVGLNPHAGYRRMRVFQLTVDGSCHTIIFANLLRHDLDLGSIILDACVVPFTFSMLPSLMSAMQKLREGYVLGINLSKEESILWKKLIPALVERCRTWNHKSTCEYQRKGGVAPLSTEENETPLCSCGQGKDLPPGFAKEDGGDWAPFAKYATRMALAPIFPVPYVEPSMSELRQLLGAKGIGGLSSLAPSSSTTSAAASSISGSAREQCDQCGSGQGPFKKCARCGTVRYCNQECQKAAWRAHKRFCEPRRD